MHLGKWFIVTSCLYGGRVLQPKCHYHPFSAFSAKIKRRICCSQFRMPLPRSTVRGASQAFVCRDMFGLISAALVVFSVLQTNPKLGDLKQKMIVITILSVDWTQPDGFTFRSLRVSALVQDSSKDRSGLNVQEDKCPNVHSHGRQLIQSKDEVIGQGAYTWFLHVLWASHNFVAGIPRGQRGSSKA